MSEVQKPAKKSAAKRPQRAKLSLEQQLEKNARVIAKYRACADRLEQESLLLQRSGDLKIVEKQRKLNRMKEASAKLEAEINATK